MPPMRPGGPTSFYCRQRRLEALDKAMKLFMLLKRETFYEICKMVEDEKYDEARQALLALGFTAEQVEALLAEIFPTVFTGPPGLGW